MLLDIRSMWDTHSQKNYINYLPKSVHCDELGKRVDTLLLVQLKQDDYRHASAAGPVKKGNNYMQRAFNTPATCCTHFHSRSFYTYITTISCGALVSSRLLC